MSDVQIISRNTTLLSPLNITATRSFSNFPPRFFGNFTPAVWCAPISGPNPTISLSFNQLVLIAGFIPGGFALTNGGSGREYVTNFNLQYSTDLDSSNFSSPQVNQIYVIFYSYTVLLWSPGPLQEFAIGDELDKLVVLEEPFLAHRLRFQVNSFITVSGDICWGMALYGCHHSEGSS